MQETVIPTVFRISKLIYEVIMSLKSMISCCLLLQTLSYAVAVENPTSLPQQTNINLPPTPGSVLPDKDELLEGARYEQLHKERAVRQRFNSTPQLPAVITETSRTEWDDITNYDVSWYHINLEIFTENNFLDGSVQMNFSSLNDGLSEVVFLAGNNVTINSVSSGEDELSIERDGIFVTASLDSPLNSGESSSFIIDYHANYGNSGLIRTNVQNVQTGSPISHVASQSEPFDAHTWWPCKDDTRDKADSLMITITSNDFNTSVSNGVLQSDIDNGDGTRTVVWNESWPIVTYLASVCITQFNHIEDTWTFEDIEMPFHDWSFGLNQVDQASVLDIGIAAMEAFSNTYNQYPFINEKYGMAQYVWGGAMEHQTCSSMGYYSESVIAHELAHQWFGDKVTCDTFHHIWLNEGWATYSEALFYEYFIGEEGLHEIMSYFTYYGSGTIYVEDPFTDVIFDGNLSYAKGAWVLHMLRHVMGSEAFFSAVRTYLGDNSIENYRTVVTDEFREFMEAEYGDDLSWFFEQWIYGEYYPEYEYAWDQVNIEGDHTLSLYVIQDEGQANHQLFTMPVDIRVTLNDGQVMEEIVWNDERHELYEFTYDQEITSVELDPDQWILSHVNELSELPNSALALNEYWIENDADEIVEIIPEGTNFTFKFSLANTGLPISDAVAYLESDSEDIELPQQQSPIAFIDFGASIEMGFGCESDSQLSGMYDLTLHVVWTGGEYEQTFSYRAGFADILLVDDDGGADYETWYTSAMEMQHFQLAENDNLPESLDQYKLIIWFTGDNERAFTPTDWQLLNDYVGQSGHLVLTGQHFASSQPANELAGLCGVGVIGQDQVDNAVVGDLDGLMGTDPLFFINGGAGNQTGMDILEGLVDCTEPLYHYFSNTTAGNAAQVLNCGDGEVATFGFGLEAVAPIGSGPNLEELISTLRDWSYGWVEVEEQPAVINRDFTIDTAYPNPFNPSTTIEYSAGFAGELEFSVYNLAGQRVYYETSRLVNQGKGKLSWTSSNLSSGVYIAQLKLSSIGSTKINNDAVKLILMK
jgi:aminopeptidase N